MNIYAIYKGEKFLFEGTVSQCAEHFRVKKETIYFLTTPTYRRRIERKRKNGKDRNCILAICLGEENYL